MLMEDRRMSGVVRDNNRGPGQGSLLAWLAAGTICLAVAGVLGGTWYAARVPPAATLKQALAEFRAGDVTSAASAFRQLAEAGNVQAAYWYGDALEHGLGTPVDAKAAIAQFQKAWSGGVPQAATQLGELYLAGNLVLPDFAKARSYLTAAAEADDTRAALDLGRVLREGIGGPADPVRAYAWLEIAALRGNTQARMERDRLLPTLQPSQQAEASQEAEALLASVRTPAPTGASA
jgi:TPR repeat protein